MRLVSAVVLAVAIVPAHAQAQSRAEQLPVTDPQSTPPASPLPDTGVHDAAERSDPNAIIQRGTEESPVPRRLLPAAPPVDTLSRHAVFGLSGTFGGLFGHLDNRYSASNQLGASHGFGIDAAYGVSSHFALGVAGGYVLHGSGSDCSDCSAEAWSVGPFVRFHIVQGVRFDPWLSASVSLHSLSLDTPDDTRSYLGANYLDLRVGGDWYATSQIGMGPLLGLQITRFEAVPSPNQPRTSVGLFLAARLVLDLPGK